MADDFNGQLAQMRVGIAGLGGLGSHIAVFLARAGVQHLHLVDFDRVDASNLSRQHYFLRDVGRLKTEALAEQRKSFLCPPQAGPVSKTSVCTAGAGELFPRPYTRHH